MAKTQKKRRAKKIVETPKDVKTMSHWIEFIGDKMREIESLESQATEQVNAIVAETAALIAPLQGEIMERAEGIALYAEQNRVALTDGGKRKSIHLPTGDIGWRTDPPSVHIQNTEKVLEALKKLKLLQFIRKKEEVDKEAMLKDREKAITVSGITIKQDEQFFVKPNQVVIEIEVDSNGKPKLLKPEKKKTKKKKGT